MVKERLSEQEQTLLENAPTTQTMTTCASETTTLKRKINELVTTTGVATLDKRATLTCVRPTRRSHRGHPGTRRA